MLHVRNLILLLILSTLFATTLHAQIPSTPAGRQFSAWLAAFNSGDQAQMQQFIDKSMPGRGVYSICRVKTKSKAATTRPTI